MQIETETRPDHLKGPVTVGDYVLKSKLGEGSFSTVWKAEHGLSGQEVALKQVYPSRLNRQLRNCFDCELNFLSSVNHPNIIRLFDFFRCNYRIEENKPMPSEGISGGCIKNLNAEGCIFLVLELCAGGSLASYLQHHGRVQEQIVRGFMQQLGAAMEILNSHHIIHRDLKPENILLSVPEDDAVLKISDFGFSRYVHPSDYAETVCGTALYMAPEVLQFQRYDEKVDMWSLGAILFELLNGYPPFHGRTNVQLLQNIKSCKCLPFSQLILPALDPDCVDMCSRLLSINPVDRLSFNEFYRHIFLSRKGVAT